MPEGFPLMGRLRMEAPFSKRLVIRGHPTFLPPFVLLQNSGKSALH